MLGAHLQRVFSSELSFKLDLAIAAGTGSGVPLGLLNSAALIKVSAERGALESGEGFSGIFIPAGSAGNATPLLKGRPVLEYEQAPALGTIGDIILADLSQYIIVDDGSKAIMSEHVAFVSDQAVFKIALQADGSPAWASPITLFNGTATRSPFVALASR